MHTAFDRAKKVKATALQVFTKSPNQWYAKPLTEQDIANYKSAASESNIGPVVAHDCYLINLCASNGPLLKKSRDAFIDELLRCKLLGIPYLNFHPGSHVGQGEETGIDLIVESLNMAHEAVPLRENESVKSVLEATAGQGTVIGHKFEQLRAIMDKVDAPERMAVCIDTCHIFAAGYDLRTEKAYEHTMQLFDDIIGIDNLVAIHINDSKKGLGLHLDRHEHIGKGAIGREGFRQLMNDERLFRVPKILETPKGDDLKEDRANLKTLRGLVEAN